MKNLFRLLLSIICICSSAGQLNAMFTISGTNTIGESAGVQAMQKLNEITEKSLRGYIKDGQEYDGIFDVIDRTSQRLTYALSGAPAQQPVQLSADQRSALEEKVNGQPAAAIASHAQVGEHLSLAYGIKQGLDRGCEKIQDGLKNHKLDHKLEFHLKINPEDVVRSTGGCLICLGTAGCIFVPWSLCAILTNCTACTAGAGGLVNPAGVINALQQAPGAAQKALDRAEDSVISYCGLGGLKLA